MSGIYPNPEDGAITPALTDPPSFDPTVPPIGTLARYFSEQCGVRLRAETLNAIISQIAAAIDLVGLAYDPAKGHVDLTEAIQYYVQQNRGAYAQATAGPQDYEALGTPTFLGYRDGQVLWLRTPVGIVSGPNARLNVDGHGFINIVRYDGSPTVATDLPADTVIGLIFRNNQWQMMAGSNDFMPVARARLPFFPHVDNPTNTIAVSSPGTGQILVPTGVTFYHRSVYGVVTDFYTLAERSFVTSASRTYHLRWTPSGGFALKDLSDPAYNPTALAENNVAFDSTFDDMLVSRVVTNAGNVATVTNLRNAFRYRTEVNRNGVVGENGNTTSWPVNFSRAPEVNFMEIIAPGGSRDTDPQIYISSRDRYQVSIYTWGWHEIAPFYSTFGYRYGIVMPGAA